MQYVGMSVILVLASACGMNAQQAAGKGETANPPVAASRSAVNNSRSNIKNNIAVAQNPNGTLKCTSGDRLCSKDEVKTLLDAANNASARERFLKDTRSTVAGLEIAPDGSVKCTASDGITCTPAHIAQLNNLAAAMPGVNDPIKGVGVGLGNKQNPSSK